MEIFAQKLYAETEYLAIKRLAESKSDFFKGEIFAMAGDSNLRLRIEKTNIR